MTLESLFKETKSAPKWAQELTIRVALDEGQDTLPNLVWKHANRLPSSGHWNNMTNTATIRAGKDRKDAKLVLLHELAHWLAGHKEWRWHSACFWDKAFDLYHRYGVPMAYAKKREEGYMKGATLAYRRLKGVRKGEDNDARQKRKAKRTSGPVN